MAQRSEIERYDQQVSTQQVGGVDYSAPRLDSETAANAFRGLGRSLLQEAEPYLKARAEKRAKEDAGRSLPLVRDENGALKRADPLPGGGLVYRDAFAKVSNYIYKEQLGFESGQKFQEIRNRNFDKPQEAWAEMTAHVEGVLKTVPDELRAEVYADLMEKQAQEFNGLTNEKWQRDRTQKQTGLNMVATQIKRSLVADLLALKNKGDLKGMADVMSKATVKFEENLKQRRDFGMLTSEAEGAEVEEWRVLQASQQQELDAFVGMFDIIQNAGDLGNDPDQLRLIRDWARTPAGPISDDVKLGNLTFKEYWEKVPDPGMRDELARWATQQLDDLNKAAAAAEKEADDARKAQEEQDAADAATAAGSAGALTPKQIDALDKLVNREIIQLGENIGTLMVQSDKRGLNHLTGIIQQYKYLPKTYRGWIEDNATGDNAILVAEVGLQMRMTQDKFGNAIGNKLYHGLSPQTQAIVEFYTNLKEQGMPTADIKNALHHLNQKTLLKKRDVFNMFVDRDGKPDMKVYVAARDKYVKAIYGRSTQELPAQIRDAIDNNLPAYMTVFGGVNPEQGMRRTIEAVASQYQPSPWGTHGFLPTEFKLLAVNPVELDKALGFIDQRGQMTGHGAFSKMGKDGRPRARLEFADGSQIAEGLGNYIVTFYDDKGYPIPGSSKLIHMDVPVMTALKARGDLQARINKNAIDNANRMRNRVKKFNEQDAVDYYGRVLTPIL